MISFMACNLFCWIGFKYLDTRTGSRFEASKEMPTFPLWLDGLLFPAAAATAVPVLTNALFGTFLLFFPLVGASLQLI